MSRRHRLLTSLVVVVLAAVGLPLVSAAAPAERTVIDVEVRTAVGETSGLVHVAPGVSVAKARTAAAGAGLRLGTRYDAIDVFVAYGSPRGFSQLATTGVATYIEHNGEISLFTDTSHAATRGSDVLAGEVTLEDGTIIDGSGIGVAVVDSGVDGTHPDLVNRMGGNVRIYCAAPGGGLAINLEGLGFSECRGPKMAVEMDDTDTPGAGGHGTHVAGIVAGDGTASDGEFHGAAPGATLYGVGIGTGLVVENALDGLAWVLENHDQVEPAIRVVNNSWGSGHQEYDPDSNFYSATHKLIEALVDAGLVVVFAAGNSGGNGSSATTSAQCLNPAPGVICVANYDDGDSGTRDGTIASSSSRGEDGNPDTYPDISAPGTWIMSTCRITLPVCSAHFSPAFDNAYAELSGTSMAAPHVAGIAAQVLQADPTLTPGAVENLLKETAHKFAWGAEYDENGTSFEKGHGLVDVLAAVETLLADQEAELHPRDRRGPPEDRGRPGSRGNSTHASGTPQATAHSSGRILAGWFRIT